MTTVERLRNAITNGLFDEALTLLEELEVEITTLEIDLRETEATCEDLDMQLTLSRISSRILDEAQ